LRCPFGCRRHHRRQRSNERSTAYYQTPTGRWLKKQLNARRSLRSTDAGGEQPTKANEQGPSASETLADELPLKLALEGVLLCESTLLRSPALPYVRMLASLIEGVEFTRRQIVRLLRRALRQHSIAYQSRTDYILRFLHYRPP
jgi:hypothetical protein